MYLKFIWQQQKHGSDCVLFNQIDVKYVRLGYIGTCNMEHIGTPSVFPWVSQCTPCFCYQLYNLHQSVTYMHVLAPYIVITNCIN